MGLFARAPAPFYAAFSSRSRDRSWLPDRHSLTLCNNSRREASHPYPSALPLFKRLPPPTSPHFPYLMASQVKNARVASAYRRIAERFDDPIKPNGWTNHLLTRFSPRLSVLFISFFLFLSTSTLPSPSWGKDRKQSRFQPACWTNIPTAMLLKHSDVLRKNKENLARVLRFVKGLLLLYWHFGFRLDFYNVSELHEKGFYTFYLYFISYLYQIFSAIVTFTQKEPHLQFF